MIQSQGAAFGSTSFTGGMFNLKGKEESKPKADPETKDEPKTFNFFGSKKDDEGINSQEKKEVSGLFSGLGLANASKKEEKKEDKK